mmetsp:Transcript_99698/g.182839  ORF Transcript_99698/g.182839 Transcript_99698/m.182839 type:complete len:367 (+) Transcript_99698:105-1205(+)
MARASEPDETTPLATERFNSELAASVLRVVSLGLMYVAVSAGMIAFNKFLMNPERFPFAVPLVLFHSSFSSVISLLLFFIMPSLFPSLTDPAKKVSVDRDLIFRGAFPIALLFSVQLVLTNTAYLHSSTAFLQMMKEANLVLVYVFSLFAALESFSWVKGRVLVAIIFATALTIHGELRFSWHGFFIQGSGQLFESLKIVFQAMLLSNAGRKLDALSYVLLVMPLCFLFLGSMFFFLVYVHPLETLQTPAWREIVAWSPVLLANCCVAFSLNLTIALFLKYSTPISFILAGIAKDACIVSAGATFLGEVVSTVQVGAFAVQLGLIWVWSMMKLFPQHFENGVISGFASLSGMVSLDESSKNPKVRV